MEKSFIDPALCLQLQGLYFEKSLKKSTQPVREKIHGRYGILHQ